MAIEVVKVIVEAIIFFLKLSPNDDGPTTTSFKRLFKLELITGLPICGKTLSLTNQNSHRIETAVTGVTVQVADTFGDCTQYFVNNGKSHIFFNDFQPIRVLNFTGSIGILRNLLKYRST